MRVILFCFVAFASLIACKNDKSAKGAGSPSGKSIDLDAFPPDQLSKIRSECTSIDLISLKKDVNLSMSFDNPQAVAIIMSLITEEKGQLTNLCTPDAHLVCQKNGEVIQELDLYYQSSCNAMVFTDSKGKQIGANKISNEGVDFFNNFLKNRTAQDTMGR